MARLVKVRTYTRNGKKVHGYQRQKRPKAKKKYVSKSVVMFHPIRDEYGQLRGFKKVSKRFKFKNPNFKKK